MTAASSALPFETPTFTTVGPDTTVENGISNGTRIGTPGTVFGRIPETIIDPADPATWPDASVIANDNSFCSPTSSSDNVTMPATEPRNVAGNRTGA